MPLSGMQHAHPDLYAKYRVSYEDREEIMQRKIPLLDCLWNDVVQFLPLHPRKVFELQVEIGLIPEIQPHKFYEINLNQLEPQKTVVFFKTEPGEENIEVKWLKDVDFTALQDIPKATRDYFKSLVGKAEEPFNYQFIPHVLYGGNLDVSNTKLITI